MGRVLYQKRYPRWEEELLDDSIAGLGAGRMDQPEQLPAHTYVQQIFQNRSSTPIPERQRMAAEFVRVARALSEAYQLDLTITEYIDHLTAEYAFESCCGLRDLKEVIRFADELAFFSKSGGHEIMLTIDYYTHAVYQGRHRVHP